MGLEFDASKVRSNLMSIKKNVRTKVIDKSLEAGAEIILEGQRDNVPIHSPNKKNRRAGGRLKASLGVGKKTGTDLKRKIHVGIQNAQERETTYGYYHEHGYSRNGKAVAGSKWMTLSFRNKIKEANKKMGEVTMKEITQGLKK